MLKKSLIVLVALAILALTMPAVADVPEQEHDSVKKIVDEKSMLKSHGWPVDFQWVEIECLKIPVYMDVGLFLEILNTLTIKEKGITLKQVEIDKYEGCSDLMKIKCNFRLELSGKVYPTDAGKEMMRAQYDPETGLQQDKGSKTDDFWKAKISKVDNLPYDDLPDNKTVEATYCETIEERRVCVQFRGASIVHAPYGKKIEVAKVHVRVRPKISGAQWEIPGLDP